MKTGWLNEEKYRFDLYKECSSYGILFIPNEKKSIFFVLNQELSLIRKEDS